MHRKKIALDLFRHAIKKAMKIAGEDRLDPKQGRFEDELRRYLRRLTRLATSDPERQFWVLLEKANLKLLRYVSHLIR
jgi:hypothetical protein